MKKRAGISTSTKKCQYGVQRCRWSVCTQPPCKYCHTEAILQEFGCPVPSTLCCVWSALATSPARGGLDRTHDELGSQVAQVAALGRSLREVRARWGSQLDPSTLAELSTAPGSAQTVSAPCRTSTSATPRRMPQHNFSTSQSVLNRYTKAPSVQACRVVDYS